MEAENKAGDLWVPTKICELPKTQHVNGQGFTPGQLVVGGKPEIILATGEGIYYLEISANPADGNWSAIQIAPQASEEGIGVGDVDGDGDLDNDGDFDIPGIARDEYRYLHLWRNDAIRK